MQEWAQPVSMTSAKQFRPSLRTLAPGAKFAWTQSADSEARHRFVTGHHQRVGSPQGLKTAGMTLKQPACVLDDPVLSGISATRASKIRRPAPAPGRPGALSPVAFAPEELRHRHPALELDSVDRHRDRSLGGCSPDRHSLARGVTYWRVAEFPAESGRGLRCTQGGRDNLVRVRTTKDSVAAELRQIKDLLKSGRKLATPKAAPLQGGFNEQVR